MVYTLEVEWAAWKMARVRSNEPWEKARFRARRWPTGGCGMRRWPVRGLRRFWTHLTRVESATRCCCCQLAAAWHRVAWRWVARAAEAGAAARNVHTERHVRLFIFSAREIFAQRALAVWLSYRCLCRALHSHLAHVVDVTQMCATPRSGRLRANECERRVRADLHVNNIKGTLQSSETRNSRWAESRTLLIRATASLCTSSRQAGLPWRRMWGPGAWRSSCRV